METTAIPYTSIFRRIKHRIIEIFGAEFNLDYMNLELSHVPFNKDGSVCTTLPAKEYGGCWTVNKMIYINPDYLLVMKHYLGDRKFSNKEVLNFTSLIIAHELGHEIASRKEFKDFVQKLTKEARSKKFTTVYLEKCKNNDTELFCEYCAYLVSGRKMV